MSFERDSGARGFGAIVRVATLVTATLAAPATARAWGVPGCTNLPEYNRALGALQGMTSACDMSVEEARRVVAAHDGVAGGAGGGAAEAPAVAPTQAAPGPRAGRRPHRARGHRRPAAHPQR